MQSESFLIVFGLLLWEPTSKPHSNRRNESITVFNSICSMVEKSEAASEHSSISFSDKMKREICDRFTNGIDLIGIV